MCIYIAKYFHRCHNSARNYMPDPGRHWVETIKTMHLEIYVLFPYVFESHCSISRELVFCGNILDDVSRVHHD